MGRDIVIDNGTILPSICKLGDAGGLPLLFNVMSFDFPHGRL